MCEFLGIYTVVFLIIGFFHLSFARIPETLFGKEIYHSILSDVVFSSLKWLVVCFFITLVLWRIRKVKDNWTLKDLGFRTDKGLGKDILAGLVVFCLIFLITLPLEILSFPASADLASNSPFYTSLISPRTPFIFILLSCIFMIITSFASGFQEEVFFRGYLQTLFSRKVSPVTGFLMTAIIFGFGHFFMRLDWGEHGIILAIGVFIDGLCLGIAYYMTKSLIVMGVVHFLINLWCDYPFILYLKGNTHGAYIFILIMAIFSLIVCIVRFRTINRFWLKTKELFTGYGGKMILIGVFLGICGLVYEWGRGLLRIKYQKENPLVLLIILLVFSAITLGISHKRREK